VTDHLGTPKELFDESGTTFLWRSEATLWDQTRKFARSDCPLRFQGQYEDAESGLYYNVHRYYDPHCGMYLSADPIGLAGGLRPHSYVHNPNAWIDPLGLAPCGAQDSRSSNPYQGVRKASEYLRSMKVSRRKRKEIIESFDISTISVRRAGDNFYALRFYDTKDARPMGQYLFETFTPQTNRSGLALPPDWNGMTGIRQWQITPGTTIIRGRVAPQLGRGAQYTGASDQIFVLKPWDYGSLQ